MYQLILFSCLNNPLKCYDNDKLGDLAKKDIKCEPIRKGNEVKTVVKYIFG